MWYYPPLRQMPQAPALVRPTRARRAATTRSVCRTGGLPVTLAVIRLPQERPDHRVAVRSQSDYASTSATTVAARTPSFAMAAAASGLAIAF